MSKTWTCERCGSVNTTTINCVCCGGLRLWSDRLASHHEARIKRMIAEVNRQIDERIAAAVERFGDAANNGNLLAECADYAISKPTKFPKRSEVLHGYCVFLGKLESTVQDPDGNRVCRVDQLEADE